MKRLAVVVLVAVLGAALVSRAEAAAAAPIQVRNNVFAPADVRVEPGQRVTWTLEEGKHTVTSDVPGRFDSDVLERTGETFSFTAPRTDVTLFYHCRIHGIAGDGDRWGSGMVGRVVVGKGSPVRAVGSDVDVRRVPSKKWPTLDAGLASLEPDGRYRIELSRGVYRPLDITPARLGFKQRPGPGSSSPSADRGTARRTSSSRGPRASGCPWTGCVSRTSASATSASLRSSCGGPIDGASMTSSCPGGRATGSGSRMPCTDACAAPTSPARGSPASPCVGATSAISSSIPYRSSGASRASPRSARARSSSVDRLFRDNGVGIALKASPSEGALHRGAHIYVNTFRNNTNRGVDPPALGPQKDMPVGAGVWIDGGAFDVVERNDFIGHAFGVAITGPSHATRIADNTLTGSREADVAWDGLGAGVCLAGNTDPKGVAATTMPIIASEIYACDLPATVGVPYPLVTATLLAWGTRAG